MKKPTCALAGMTLATLFSFPANADKLPDYQAFPLVKSITQLNPITNQGYYKEWYDENAKYNGKYPHFVATYLLCDGDMTKQPTGLSDNRTGDLYILTPEMDYRRITKDSIQTSRNEIAAAKEEARKTGDMTQLMTLVEQAQQMFPPSFQYCDQLPEELLVPQKRPT